MKLQSFNENIENSISFQPSNVEAEQLVLGNLLTNNEAFSKVGDFLNSEHFFEPVHQQIYQNIVDFFSQGLIATPVTLKANFEKDIELQNLGGSKYLFDLAAGATGIINIKEYAKLIFDLYLKRKLRDLGTDLVNEISDAKKPKASASLIELTEHKLFKLASEGKFEADYKKLNVSLNNTLVNVQAALESDAFCGLPTDLIDLDQLLGGMQNSDLIILAGRPSMGKTALAINIALNCSEYFAKEDNNKSVGFLSLEMSSEQLASRMIAMKSGINAKKFRSGNFSKDDFSKIVKANKELHELRFFIDDTPAQTISAIRTRARRLKRQQNLGLLVIDYLQLVRGSSNSDNRVQEITEITQNLKAIAKELNIPVIALSQLSRAVENREDKRPQLADLRESGSIEQDADVVMFIYREEYYLSRMEPDEAAKNRSDWETKALKAMNKAEIIIAKQRHGPIGNVEIRFNANTTKFDNLAKT
jgi:replicative DNA helicase